jgi:exopolysaccharide biosynthesis polyprenyl glycosylphosphotransferase
VPNPPNSNQLLGTALGYLQCTERCRHTPFCDIDEFLAIVSLNYLKNPVEFSLDYNMYKRSDLFYTVLHIPFDVLAIFLAFITSYWLRGNGLEIYRLPYMDYLWLIYRIIPIWFLIFALQGLYTKRYLFASFQNFTRIAIAVLAGWASFVVFLVFLRTEQTLVFPRLMLIYILVFSLLYVLIERISLRFLQFLIRSAGIGRSRVLLVAPDSDTDGLESALISNNDPALRFIKRVEAVEPTELASHFKKYDIDEVIIDDHSLSDNRILEYVMCAHDNGVACHLVPNMFEVQASNVLFETIAGTPIITFRQTPLDGWGRIVKRIIDVIFGTLGLILVSPIIVVVAILISIFDTGPIFFAHARIARGGKKFRIYKFRTMRQKYSGKSSVAVFRAMGRDDLVAEFERDQKVKDDPRVSPIGKFLRKTSIDELPQFLNVVRGELSLVGPRPIIEDELKRYGKWGSYLLSIKPGLTGLWQVSGRNDTSYDERVQLDAHYVQNWSLWQDFIIMFKTGIVLLFGKTGY